MTINFIYLQPRIRHKHYNTILTHIKEGKTSMVDISTKPTMLRNSEAQAIVSISQQYYNLIKTDLQTRTSVFNICKIGGVLGAKNTNLLIPLSHQINLTKIEIQLELDNLKPEVNIRSSCTAIDQTGVEMEALSAVSLAALNLYDMGKAVDKHIVIKEIKLISKTKHQIN